MRHRIIRRKKYHSKTKHYVLTGKHKLNHKIGKHKVKGIWHNGRFYSEKKLFKKGVKHHHHIIHRRKHYYTAHKTKHSSLESAWGWVKDKYKVGSEKLKTKYKAYKEKKREQRYLKENASESEKAQIERDIHNSKLSSEERKKEYNQEALKPKTIEDY